MGKRVKGWNVLGRVVFLLAFAASAAVFWYTRTGEGYMDLAINAAFDVIAAIFIIIYFEGCARPLARVTSSLSQVTDAIRRSRGTTKDLWEEFTCEQLFVNWRLDERYDAYIREVQRLQRENDLTAHCPIEDYIDEDVLYSAVSKSFCDQIGGIMTGLGILFTFIGLVYGLRNFDASSVDVMQTSTQALMAGIKIAFLTSIFGLVYSLLFGLFYRKLLKQSMQALYDFQDVFTERVRPSRENAAANVMIQLQEEQIAALEHFGDNVGRQVGKSVVDILKPTAETLQRTISRYVSVAIEDQQAGMDRVVRYFLDSMNTSLGNVFGQLKSRTEELARWEREMTVSVRTMLEGIGGTGQALTQAQAAAREITDVMASYTGAIEKLTAAQGDVIRDMQALAETYGQRREEESALVRSTADSARAAAASMDKSLAVARSLESMARGVNEAGMNSARRMAEAGEQITAAAQSVEGMADRTAAGLAGAAERLSQSAERLESGVSRGIGDGLAAMEASLSRLNSSLEAAAQAVDGVNRAAENLPRTVAAVDDNVKANARAIDEQLRALLRAVTDTQKTLSRFNTDLERRARL